ncbi:MAG: Rid family hydrolase [Acidimicrobiia bacterium]|nr:Rid family hydrolase [Acidimicrobiia bacterium]
MVGEPAPAGGIDAAVRPVRLGAGGFPWLDTSRYTFSLGLASAGRLWQAGHTAGVFDGERGRVGLPATMRDQADICWDKTLAVLAAAGSSPAGLRCVTEYVTTAGLADHGVAAEVRRERLGDAAPPVRTVVVESLVRPGALLEVEVEAEVAEARDAAGRDPAVVAAHPAVLHLPSLRGRGETLAAQVRSALVEASRRLGALGASLSNVVNTVEFTLPATRSDYRGTGEVRRELLGPDFPAATGILASRLAEPGALVSIDVTAVVAPRSVVNPGWAMFDRLTFSPAVRCGDLVFLSGTTGLDPDTGRVRAAGDVAGQAEAVFDQFDTVLRAAGGRGLADLVKTVEFVPSAALDGYRAVSEVRRRRLAEPFPVSTGVACASLLQPDWLIEINGVAVVAS